MNITEQNLKAFKEKMRIYHSHEDSVLKNLLESSYLFLKNKCGDFSLVEFNQGVELVYQRARYDYYGNLEYFDNNYMSMVMNFSLSNLPIEIEEDVNDGETTV